MKILLAVALLVLPAAYVSAGEGHEAGYQWAQENGIRDPANCFDENGDPINNSESFSEGCLEYLEDNGFTNDDQIIDKNDSDATDD